MTDATLTDAECLAIWQSKDYEDMDTATRYNHIRNQVLFNLAVQREWNYYHLIFEFELWFEFELCNGEIDS